MTSEKPLIITNWQKLSPWYGEGKELVKVLQEHKPFSSRLITGLDRYGSSDNIGERKGHSEHGTLCYRCGKNTCYDVFSYRLQIYSVCLECGKEEMYVETYAHKGSGFKLYEGMVNSHITSNLQNCLMQAYPSFKEAREAYLQEVQLARKWLTSNKRAMYGIAPNMKLTDRDVLTAYRFHGRKRVS